MVLWLINVIGIATGFVDILLYGSSLMSPIKLPTHIPIDL